MQRKHTHHKVVTRPLGGARVVALDCRCGLLFPAISPIKDMISHEGAIANSRVCPFVLMCNHMEDL